MLSQATVEALKKLGPRSKLFQAFNHSLKESAMRRKPYELDLSMKAVSLERFHWQGGKLTAFESDLRNEPFDGSYPWLQQFYQDACDVGIAIRSHHTGNIEAFTLVEEETREGDILLWRFKPVKEDSRVKEVIVFND